MCISAMLCIVLSSLVNIIEDDLSTHGHTCMQATTILININDTRSMRMPCAYWRIQPTGPYAPDDHRDTDDVTTKRPSASPRNAMQAAPILGGGKVSY